MYYFIPMYHYIHQKLDTGLIPLWNPLILGGQPLLGNPQMGIFYPITCCIDLFNTWRYVDLMLWLHLILFGNFLFSYLKRWSNTDIAALTGVFTSMGSGYLLGRMQFPPMFFSITYLPLILLLVDREVDAPSTLNRIYLCVAITLLILAAHSQIAYLNLGLAAFYLFMRLLSLQKENRLRKRISQAAIRFLPAIAVFAIACCGAMVQLLPTVQLILSSQRELLSPSSANRFVLHPPQLLTFFWPHFFGSPAAADYWAGGNAWEPSIFVGWIPLLLLYLAVRKPVSHFKKFWLFIIAFSFWLSLGSIGGAYLIAFYTLPGLSLFHDPARFLIPGVFGICILASLGMDRFCSKCKPKLLAPAALIFIILPLAYYAKDWEPGADISILSKPSKLAETLKSAPGKVYLPAEETYWKRFVTEGYADYGSGSDRGVELRMETLLPNLSMLYNLKSASGYEPVAVAGMSAMNLLTTYAMERDEPDTPTFYRFLQAHTILTPVYLPIYAPSLRREKKKWPMLIQYTNMEPTPAAWVVKNIRWINGKYNMEAAISSPGFQPLTTAVIESEHRELRNNCTKWAGPENPVMINKYYSTGLKLSVTNGVYPAYLVTTIPYYPGWKAFIDGKPVTIYRTDLALCGVFIPPGKHSIDIRFSPDDYRVGLYVSLVTWMCILCAFIILYLERRLF